MVQAGRGGCSIGMNLDLLRCRTGSLSEHQVRVGNTGSGIRGRRFSSAGSRRKVLGGGGRRGV